jgi:NTP pyrophosphatase (non-canonical NTP hydrolase)
LNDIFTQIRQERARQDQLHPNTDLTPAEWMIALGEEYGEVYQQNAQEQPIISRGF